MSIQENLAAAKAQAEAAVPATTNANSTPAPVGRRMGATDFMNTARTQVDAYLKVGQYGMSIGKDSGLVESFKATIDLSTVKYCQQVRFGNPPQYFKTFDGVKVADGSGRAWSDILAQAKMVDSRKSSDPYPTAEIIMVATEEVKDNKGKVVATPGTTISYTPPYTGGDPLSKFLADVENDGGDVNSSTVSVVVGYEAKSRNSNNWGNVTWTLQSVDKK